MGLRRCGKFAELPELMILAQTINSVSKILVILWLLCDVGEQEQEQRKKKKHSAQEWCGGGGQGPPLQPEIKEVSG